jgi:sulfatase modifying factor 1
MESFRASLGLGIVAGTLLSCELLINTSDLDSKTDAGEPREGGRSDAAAESSASDGECPKKAGPAMVRAGSFCIDRTEVTGADYAAFVATDAGGSLEPPQCTWKHGKYDNGGLVNGESGPAGDVDWCDAYVYCKWAGKRLCGAIGGGPAPYDSYKNASVDQWFSACSGPKHDLYPYGPTFEQARCNGLLEDGGYPDGASTYTVLPVGSKPECVGGYPGIFDMSGNVAEWEDSCDDGEGGDAAAQPCNYRGGSAHSGETELSCPNQASFSQNYARSRSTDDLGFRCCGP